MSVKATVVLSGGMDSAVALWWAKEMHEVTNAISINYGQRHKKELKCAAKLAKMLDVPHQVINLTDVAKVLPGNALTDKEVEVPYGHYADNSMRATVVPNRNMMLLSVAIASAAASKANSVVYGAHAGDHPIYPDCRPEFIDCMNMAAQRSWYEPIQLVAPFKNKTKTDIVRLGADLGVPFEHTWSCYEGGDVHCGKCGTCVERIEAFREAGVPDPTVYAHED